MDNMLLETLKSGKKMNWTQCLSLATWTWIIWFSRSLINFLTRFLFLFRLFFFRFFSFIVFFLFLFWFGWSQIITWTIDRIMLNFMLMIGVRKLEYLDRLWKYYPNICLFQIFIFKYLFPVCHFLFLALCQRLTWGSNNKIGS